MEQQPAAPVTRKRRRKKVKKQEGRKKISAQNVAILKDWADEEKIPRFSEESVEDLAQSKPRRTSLPPPILLRQREVGMKWGGRHRRIAWQTKMLAEAKDENDEILYELRETLPKDRFRLQWRQYARRSIPFSMLATPHNCAILAVERTGSYLLGLGAGIPNESNNTRSQDDTSCEVKRLPVLTLNFYGIPSRSVAARSKRATQTTNPGRPSVVSPLLRTITLLSERSAELSGNRNRVGILSAAVTVPIRLLISSDWKIGVAFLRDTALTEASFPELPETSGNDECLGRLILFSLPQHENSHKKPVQTFQCSNVRIGAFSAFTMRNLLWKVNFIPNNRGADGKDSSYLRDCIFDSIAEVPAYLVFNDEDDGFRLTWVLDSSWQIEQACVKPLEKAAMIHNGPCILNTDERAWEQSMNDPLTGQKILTPSLEQQAPSLQQGGGLSIAFEAYLSVETILGAIISARKKLADEFMPKDNEGCFPEYFYNLLSVNDGGRLVELLVVFKHRQKTGSVGVVVSLDLFTEAFTTLNWVRNPSVKNSASLRNLCNSLALNCRMRRRRLGPYSVDPDDKSSWEALCRETDCAFDFDLERDSNPYLWKSFLKQAKRDRERGVPRKETQQMIPKEVSFSSLYPDCQLITNRAVALVKPVSSLTGSMSPVEVMYGCNDILGDS